MKESHQDEILLSVIVPVYNVEKYLPKCLDSILGQTFRDFELIIVNDGSPDNSSDIIDAYSQKDSRIRIVNKENGGLSSARNRGVREASGKYLAFIDSDDWIDKEMFQCMLQKGEEVNADIIFCDVRGEYEDGTVKVIYQQATNFPEVIDVAEHPRLFLEVECFSCNKIIARRLFIDFNIEFPEGLLYEDVGTFPRLFFMANRLVRVPKQFYHYTVREGAITQMFSLKGLDYLKVVKVVEDFLRSKGLWNQYEAIMLEFYLYHVFFNLSIYCGHISNGLEREQAFDKLYANLKENKINWRKIKGAKRNGSSLWKQRSLAKRVYYRLFWDIPFVFKRLLNLYHEFRIKSR
mgnify:CR=1 FL=1